MNIQKALSVISVVSAFAVSGCATGAKISETPEAQRPPASGLSRIVVYRTAVMGAAIQPTVKVDGKPSGSCTPNGAFYVDVPRGRHTVSAATEVTRSTTVDTSRETVAYVECSIGFGFLAGRPKLVAVTPRTGRSAVQNLVFTGQY